MAEIVPDTETPLVIGATGMDAIRQNLRVILTTLAYSVPLDRAFAHNGDVIDSPSPTITARLVASLTDAIEKYEPRVVVESVVLEAADGNVAEAMQGRLTPRVIYHLKEGVTV